MNQPLIKKDLDTWLDEVDYAYLNSSKYLPSEFSLNFMNFIKLVNGEEGEANKTPPVHLKMLDKITSGRTRIVNLCWRGSGKALALDTPILTPTGYTPMGDIHPGDLVIDREGNTTEVTFESEIFHKPTYKITLADSTSFVASEDHLNIVQWRSSRRGKMVDGVKQKTELFWKEDVLTTKELVARGVHSIKKVCERCPSGTEMKYFIPLVEKAIDFPERPTMIDPYTMGVILGDGNIAKKSGYISISCHEADLEELLAKIPYKAGNIYSDKRHPATRSFRLGELSQVVIAQLGEDTAYDKTIPNAYLYNSVEVRLAVLRGLMDTDGTISPGGYATFCSVSSGLAEGVRQLVKSLGGSAKFTHHTNKHAGYFQVVVNLPEYCPFSMKRKADLWVPGKTINSGKRIGIASVELLREVVPSKCIAVASDTHSYLIEGCTVTHNTTVFMEYLTLYLAVFHYLPGLGAIDGMLYVADSMENGAKNARKNIEHRFEKSEFLQKYITKAKFTDSYLEFENTKGENLGTKLFGATTGLRGTKIFGKRPRLVVMDDLISDEAAKSPTVMQTIRNTVYKGVNYALDPTKQMVIFNGTPFDKQDIILEAVESGAWDVNVWPVCEKFPCSEEEFQGAWPDRFPYSYVKEQYDLAVGNNQSGAFYQELMLRISSEDDRLVQESEIQWYDRTLLLRNRDNFNFYITTDFATSDKQTADYSVISVWAYNANREWFWVDGICEKQTMDKNVDALFKLVQQYKPQSVGIETTGQQGGFVSWLQKEQISRNIWFTFAGTKNVPGIRPAVNKLVRFNLVVPWFKAGKIYFPEQMKTSTIMGTFMQQIKLCTVNGIKGHDDCIDTISMLGYLTPWEPSANTKIILTETAGDMYHDEEEPLILSRDSYIV